MTKKEVLIKVAIFICVPSVLVAGYYAGKYTVKKWKEYRAKKNNENTVQKTLTPQAALARPDKNKLLSAKIKV